MSYLAFFVGTLIPTAIASRIILIATRGWNGGMRRLVLAHVVSLLICGLFGGMGMADGGAFAGGQALIQYAPAQALWFLVDIYRKKRAARHRQTKTTTIDCGEEVGNSWHRLRARPAPCAAQIADLS